MVKAVLGEGCLGVLRFIPQDALFFWRRHQLTDGAIILLMGRNRFLAIVSSAALLVGCEGPHVWDYQIGTPKEADLAGTYKIARFHNDVDEITGFSRKDPIQIVLNLDHTTQVVGFPEFDVLADGVLCKITESGTWKLDRGPEPQVHFHLRSVPKVDPKHSPFGHQCTPEFDLSVLGHVAPYRLHWSFGGPDVDRGIEFELAQR